MSVETAPGGLAGQLAEKTPRRVGYLTSRQRYVFCRVENWLKDNPTQTHHDACAALQLDVQTFILAQRIMAERRSREASLPVASDREAFSTGAGRSKGKSGWPKGKKRGRRAPIVEAIAKAHDVDLDPEHAEDVKSEELSAPCQWGHEDTSPAQPPSSPAPIPEISRQTSKIATPVDDLGVVQQIVDLLSKRAPATRGRILGAAAVLVGAVDVWREPA